MYKFPYYTEQDQEKILVFMNNNPFVLITGMGQDYPVATYIPVEISNNEEGKMILSGHMMRKTDHHLAFENNNNVLVIFNGPHCYVSASWYTTPKVGSTWNYMTVHAKGRISFTNEEGTYNAVKAVSDKYEGKETAAAFDKLPAAYINSMVKAIVGFHIEVERIDNTFKLSQNRDEESKKNIIHELTKRGDGNSLAIAAEMESRLTS
jgi:transcriptional regulator